MRIIAGDFKGRRLKTPEDYQIRPTTDKVKEAMFSIVAPWIPGGVCVDLFAGTGNLGLEALSRGADRCYFCDNSARSLAIIRSNIEYCRAQERATVLAGDFASALERIKEKADLILLDPPYDKDLYEECLTLIDSLDILADDGIVVAEHRRELALPQTAGRLEKIKERRYGSIVLSIYQ